MTYFKMEFLAETNFVKAVGKRGSMTIGTLSIKPEKGGYVNVGFKCFDEVAEEIERIGNKQLIEGEGVLRSNTYNGKTNIQILITGFEVVADEKSAGSYTPPKQKKQQKSDNDDIDLDLEEDLPF